MENINPNLNLANTAYGTNQNVQNTINNNTVVKSSGEQKDEYRKLVMTPVLGAGIYYGMRKFNDACSGDYSSSLLGKSERFGDKIAKWKIFDNDFVHNFVDKTIKCKNSTITYLRENSAICRAMFDHPTKPQFKMVVMQASGPIAETAKNAIDEMWKQTSEGTNIEKVQAFGFSTKEEMQECMKNAHEKSNIQTILRALEEQGDKVEMTPHGGKIPFSARFTADKKPLYLTDMLGDWSKNLFCKKLSYSEYANKIKALQGNGQAVSRLGKHMPRAVIRGLEGLTQTSTGGVIAAIMGAYFLADAVNNTIKADGFNEKRKALPENLIYLASWVLTMPLSIRLMHNACGLKDMGCEDVDAYRKALYKHNAKASGKAVDENKFVKIADEIRERLGGRFNNKAEFKASKKALNEMLYKNAKWYQRPLIWLGKTVSVGLEQVRPYVAKDAGETMTLIKNSKFWLKQGAGYPMRFLIFAMVTSPFFGKIGAKISHIFFGKPKVSVLDEGKEDATKNAKEAQANQYIGQPQAVQQKPAQAAPQVAQTTPMTVSQAPTTPQTPAQAPAQATKPTYTYIPSSTPVQIVQTDNQPSQDDMQKINKATARFDKLANNIQNTK